MKNALGGLSAVWFALSVAMGCGDDGGTGMVDPSEAELSDLAGIWRMAPVPDGAGGTETPGRVMHILQVGELERLYGIIAPGGLPADDWAILDMPVFVSTTVTPHVRPEDVAEGRIFRLIRRVGDGLFEVAFFGGLGLRTETWQLGALSDEVMVFDNPSLAFRADPNCGLGLLTSGSALYRTSTQVPEAHYRVAAFDPEGHLRAYVSPVGTADDPGPHTGFTEGDGRCPVEAKLIGPIEPDYFDISPDGAEHFVQRYRSSAFEPATYVRRLSDGTVETIELEGIPAGSEVLGMTRAADGTIRALFHDETTGTRRFVLSADAPAAEPVPELPAGATFTSASPDGRLLLRVGGETVSYFFETARGELDAIDVPFRDESVRVDDEGRLYVIERLPNPGGLRPDPYVPVLARYTPGEAEPERWVLDTIDTGRAGVRFNRIFEIAPDGTPWIAYAPDDQALYVARLEGGSLRRHDFFLDTIWRGGIAFALGADNPLQVGTPIIVTDRMTFGSNGRMAFSDGYQYIVATPALEEGEPFDGREPATLRLELDGLPEGGAVEVEGADARCTDSCTVDTFVGARLVLRFELPPGHVVELPGPTDPAPRWGCPTPGLVDRGLCAVTVSSAETNLSFGFHETPYLAARGFGTGPGILDATMREMDGRIQTLVYAEVSRWERPNGPDIVGVDGFALALGLFVDGEMVWARELPGLRRDVLDMRVLASGDVAVLFGPSPVSIDELSGPRGYHAVTLDAADGTATRISSVATSATAQVARLGPSGGMVLGGAASPGDAWGNTELGLFERVVDAEENVVREAVYGSVGLAQEADVSETGEAVLAYVEGESLHVRRDGTDEVFPVPSGARVLSVIARGDTVLRLSLPAAATVAGVALPAGESLLWIDGDPVAVAVDTNQSAVPIAPGRALLYGELATPEGRVPWAGRWGVYAAHLEGDTLTAAVQVMGEQLRFRPFAASGGLQVEVDLTRLDSVDLTLGRL